MRRICSVVRNHAHFFIVIVVLTVVMTFPTIVYVFKTDVFWVPTSFNRDVYIKFWDVWYGGQILSGQADRFHTELIFFPEGVSLVFHPVFLLYSFVVNALQELMPLSNAFSLCYLLIIISCALSAYIYLLWLFKDKWIALLGATVFGFCSHIYATPHWPEISWIATLPLASYCFHRGIKEHRLALVVLAGGLTGLTSTIVMYHYVVLLIVLGMYIIALGAARWREGSYWRQIILLIAVVVFTSAWRIIPMFQNAGALGEATSWHDLPERSTDLISFFVDDRHPVYGPLAETIFRSPDETRTSRLSFLGFLPLALTAIGLCTKTTRRQMLPWLALCLVFIILRLGSTLNVNGTEFEHIFLPKYYLDRLLPFVFQPFRSADHFMAGARFPLAVLACFGVTALRDRFSSAFRPSVVLVLIAIVGFEYFIPIQDGPSMPGPGGKLTADHVAFAEWLKQEEDQDIALVHLPLGRPNPKFYLFYQTLTGYPQTEASISRTPERAYDYVREHSLLKAWYDRRPVSCDSENRDSYLSALLQLENDGFSHVVYHRDLLDAADIADSFRTANPSYADDYVSIYRVSDLRQSCP